MVYAREISEVVKYIVQRLLIEMKYIRSFNDSRNMHLLPYSWHSAILGELSLILVGQAST